MSYNMVSSRDNIKILKCQRKTSHVVRNMELSHKAIYIKTVSYTFFINFLMQLKKIEHNFVNLDLRTCKR